MNSPVPSQSVQRENLTRVSAAEGYRLWSRTYDTDPNPLLALEFRILSRKLDSLARGIFLDIACGTGRWMAFAAARGAKAMGVDLSLEMLTVANKKPPLRGCLVRGNGQCLPFPDQCADMVMCSFSIGYMNCLGQLVFELGRVARRGGTVLVSDLHPFARQMGWRRSFRCGTKAYEIEGCPYTTEELLASGHSSGLRLREILQPHISAPEHLLMQKAGKEELFERVAAIPAVLAVEWERL